MEKAVGAWLDQPVVFPPRGGQHNSHHQCRVCQTGLRVRSETEHQCPVCGRIYRGSPYDDAVFKVRHRENHLRAWQCAWLYAVSGERAYADYASTVIAGYGLRYLTYELHDSECRSGERDCGPSGARIFEQTLSEAETFSRLLGPAYDLVGASGALTAADHRTIRERMIRPMLKQIAGNGMGVSNWQSWHNAALLWGGALMGDERMVRKALWDPRNGVLFQLTRAVSPDGMWREGSWGYHTYALRALSITAAAGLQIGIDLWGHGALARMFRFPTACVLSHGLLPRTGNGHRLRIGSTADLLSFALNFPESRRILGVLDKGRELERRLFGSTSEGRAHSLSARSYTFPESNLVVLRTAGASRLSASMVLAGDGEYHGHYDRLSFELTGCKQQIAVDRGSARSQAYRLPIHREWYKATISHNAVVAGRSSVVGGTVKLELFGSTRLFSAALVSCNDMALGLLHRRLLLLTPEYLLVADHLTGTRVRRYDWMLHVDATRAVCPVARTMSSLGPATEGGRYITNVRSGVADGPVHVRFPAAEVDTHVFAAGCAGTAVCTGVGPGGSPSEQVPLLMLGRKARAAFYLAAIVPVAHGGQCVVKSVGVERGDSSGAAVVVNRRGRGTDRVVLHNWSRLEVYRDNVLVMSVPAGVHDRAAERY